MTSQAPSLAGGQQITKVQDAGSNIGLLLWGPPGVGKTTLACTAPGEKLIVNFDPNGPASVAARQDVSVLDYSAARNDLTAEFKRADPFGIGRHLGDFETVILDSLSSVQELTVRSGIEFARSIKINSNIENPGMAAFQARNNLLMELIRNIQSLCQRMGKHLILIGHEGPKDKDKEGAVINIPIMLGGGLPTHVSVRLSEIWTMIEVDKKKTVGVRPTRLREVAKSRMFDTTGSSEFYWRFNPNNPDDAQVDMTIAGWYERWLGNGRKKIALPK